jgi:hypothetical protein
MRRAFHGVLGAAVIAIAAGFACKRASLPAPVARPLPSASAAGPRHEDVGPLVRLGFTEDRLSPNDAPLVPDGARDYAFRVRLAGEVAALALIASDAHGNPSTAEQWDTIVGDTPIPAVLHVPFKLGAETASLAVVDAGGTLLNPSVTMPLRVFHDELVTIYAADPWGFFREGRAFTLLVLRPDGRVDRSTVVLV